jgi:hypothetical protein
MVAGAGGGGGSLSHDGQEAEHAREVGAKCSFQRCSPSDQLDPLPKVSRTSQKVPPAGDQAFNT